MLKERKRWKETIVHLSIDLFPDESLGALTERFQAALAANPKKSVRNAVRGFVPERLLELLFARIGFGDEVCTQVKKQDWTDFLQQLKRFTLKATGTLDFDKAFVTGGGVSIKEIDPKTMMSKKAERLFFAGEILDIHGYTGGYNITAAFVTGHCDGSHAAKMASDTVS
jgi:predicted Rossmann fold flavoprotein